MKTISYLSIISFIFLTMSVYGQENKAVKERLEKKYDWVCYHSSGKGWYSVKSNNKEGACDINGKELIPPEYDDVHVYYEDKYIKATKNGETTIFDLSGKKLFHGEYDDVFWWQMKHGFCGVKKNGKCGAINKGGKIIVPCEYDETPYYIDENGLCGVRKNEKEGLYDVKNSKQIVQCKYDMVAYSYFPLGHGYVVIDNEKYGFVDSQGKEVVPCVYSFLTTQFTHAPYLVAVKGGTRPSDATPVSEYPQCEPQKGKWGVLNLGGEEVVPFKYDYIDYVKDDVAVICKNGKMKYEAHGKSYIQGKEYVRYFSTYDTHNKGFYNIQSKKYTDLIYDDDNGKVFIGEGYIGCKDKQNKWGYLDAATMEVMIPFEYDQISVFANGIAQVKKDGKTSFLTDPRKGTSLQLANGGGKSIKVDGNIPQTDRIQAESFAFIIANENYAHMNGADYSINDGKVFKEYCVKTFGMPENNVRYYEDATYGNFSNVIQRIKDIADVYEGDASIVIYYSGLGMTDATTKEKYILPTDANASALGVTGVSVSELMGTLNTLKTKQTIVIIDASFTGMDKSGQTLAQNRSVAIASKSVKTDGNTILCLGSDDATSAYSSKEYAHSLFTYALLDKIQDSKGKCSLNEVVSHATNWVKKESLKLYNKIQKPVVIATGDLNLQNIKF